MEEHSTLLRSAVDSESNSRLLDRLCLSLAVVSGVLVTVALLIVFGFTPEEKVMGARIRILFIHVGAAWVAYLSYAVTAVAAVTFLYRRELRWDRLAAASAEWGVVLTAVTLITGSIWARAVNGWWWRWDDPRLNLTLLMLFLYSGYLLLRRALDGEARAAVSAVIAIAGIPAAVLNHFATVYFRTYHPDPILGRPDAPAADGVFLTPLFLSLAAYTALYVWGVTERIRLSSLRDRLSTVRFGH